MARRLPLYVYREKTRHGKFVYYFRKGKGQRVRLPDFKSPEFLRAYTEALRNVPGSEQQTLKGREGTLQWLISTYMTSPQWERLSPATRKQRSLIFDKSITKSGHVNFKEITGKHILNGLNDRASTPFLANNYLKAMRGLFSWALMHEYVEYDPTSGVKALPSKTDGFPPWTVEDAKTFADYYAVGTRERLAFELLLLTGLRRQDVVKAGPQHMKGAVFSLMTSKTGEYVTVEFPESLMGVIAKSPTGESTFVVGKKGKPYKKESFTNWFSSVARKAGVPKSPHGIRKLSATLAADSGATVHELNAQYGWRTFRQAETYTKGAERAKMGVKNSRRLAEHIEALRPAPNPDAPRTGEEN